MHRGTFFLITNDRLISSIALDYENFPSSFISNRLKEVENNDQFLALLKDLRDEMPLAIEDISSLSGDHKFDYRVEDWYYIKNISDRTYIFSLGIRGEVVVEPGESEKCYIGSLAYDMSDFHQRLTIGDLTKYSLKELE